MLQIRRMPVGQIGTNCYLLEDLEAKTCAVIDPGDQANDIAREIDKAGLTPKMILVTHGHFDHVLGVPGLLERYPGLPVYIHDKEVNWNQGGDQYMLMNPVEGIHTVKDVVRLTIVIPYTLLGKIQNIEKNESFTIEDIAYTDTVTLTISMDSEDAERVKALFMEVSSGSAKILQESFSVE